MNDIEYIGKIIENHTLDLKGKDIQILTLAANIRFGIKGLLKNKSQRIIVFIEAFGDRTLSFDSKWLWISRVPTNLTNGQVAVLELFTKGNKHEDVVAYYYQVGSSPAVVPIVGYWGYEDFATIVGVDVTLTQNENATTPETDLSSVVNSSAVITDQDGKGVYDGSIKLLSKLVAVSTHTSTSVTLDKIPHASYAPFRVWFLMQGVQPDGAIIAPDFVTKKRIEFIEAAFVNQYGDIMAGDLDMNSNQLLNLISPVTNGEPLIYGNAEELYFYDTSKSKKLSSSVIQVSAGRNAGIVTNVYLRTPDGSPMNLNGFSVPYDCTLVGISMSGRDNDETWTAEIRKNGVATIEESLQIINAYENHDFTKNKDFSAGDRIQIYMNGTSISYPFVIAFFRRRTT